jgi:hypothetical protein
LNNIQEIRRRRRRRREGGLALGEILKLLCKRMWRVLANTSS